MEGHGRRDRSARLVKCPSTRGQHLKFGFIWLKAQISAGASGSSFEAPDGFVGDWFHMPRGNIGASAQSLMSVLSSLPSAARHEALLSIAFYSLGKSATEPAEAEECIAIALKSKDQDECSKFFDRLKTSADYVMQRLVVDSYKDFEYCSKIPRVDAAMEIYDSRLEYLRKEMLVLEATYKEWQRVRSL